MKKALTEVDELIGDAGKAKQLLSWKPEYTFEELIREMTLADLEKAKKEKHMNHYEENR